MIRIGLFILGIFAGACGMVWHYEQKPTVTVEQDGARAAQKLASDIPMGGSQAQQVRDAAPPLANTQRVKEMRFALQKLERLKAVHDATLREAATNQGDIRQMVKALEVTR